MKDASEKSLVEKIEEMNNTQLELLRALTSGISRKDRTVKKEGMVAKVGTE